MEDLKTVINALFRAERSLRPLEFKAMFIYKLESANRWAFEPNSREWYYS